MDRPTDPGIAEMDGDAALPRANGELVFHDRWQRRLFAMAVSLCEQGLYEWDEFRDCLVAELARSEGSSPPTYYERWLAAFEKLLLNKDLWE